MNNLTVERFKTLLLEDEAIYQEKEKISTSYHKATRGQRQQLEKSILELWQHVGVLPLLDSNNKHAGSSSSTSGHWMRPFPSILYRSPLSIPQTRLVDWNSLPLPVQTSLLQSSKVQYEAVQNINKECAHIVEVPISYLTLPSKDDINNTTLHNANSTMLSRRAVKGNLSDKLSEYARGIAGQRNQLFRPGGLGADEITSKSSVEQRSIDHYRTEEAIARSRAVLDKGSEQAWKDGTILSAPPGLGFTVGLSWSDVFSQDHTALPDQQHEKNEDLYKHQSHEMDGQELSLLTLPADFAKQTVFAPVTTTKGMFSRNYFDNDSLFGSSSSDEDEGSDDEVEAASEESCVKPSQAEADSTVSLTGNQNHPVISEMKPIDDLATLDTGEIDKLLTELTVKDANKILDKKLKCKNEDVDNLANPLQLAENQAQNQNDANRKSWASTKLLPIRDFNDFVPNPALTFPFTLDDFQQQAIARLERSESVFIAAHTSAGKTVVAEYAVALAMQHATRCVYTSPIKALSNQKFRDFSLKFGSDKVGLITGDLQVNADNSTCIIMTTEILRSMLYRGADLTRDVEFVIFDEVHYVNDTERGVVWEEVIIMLPSYVNLIFLSATTPNTIEFSDWIGRTKRRPVHVIKTNYRPVPLSHHLWAGSKLHKILEGNGHFIELGYSSTVDALIPQSAKDPSKKKGEQKGRPPTGAKELTWQAQGTKQNWISLVRFLNDTELLTPTVVFTFSKKKCEEIANMLSSLDLNTAKERSAVTAFTLQTIGRLSQVDSKLPQVLIICEMVQRGIGVHHGGLLPLLKEMVEILFSRNLIKVLFATETFAMGVNMPAKAVVFNSIRKHDGTQFRILEPGEYTQMAGRAGRRGLDKVGTVIICCFGESPPPQPILRQMLTGSSTKLSSQFRLTYNMILNLLKVEEMSVESMIKRSFSEFATQRALTANEYPQLLERGARTLEKLEEKFRQDANSRVGAEDLEQYFADCNQLLLINYEIFSYIRQSDNTIFEDLFQPGRIMFITAAWQLGAVYSPAIILRAPCQTATVQADKDTTKMVCLILLPSSYVPDIKQSESKKPGTVGYLGSVRQRHYLIEEVDLDQIIMISGGKRRSLDCKLLLKTEEKGRSADSPWADFSSLGQRRSDPFAGMKAVGRKGDNAPELSSAKEGQLLDQVVGYLIDSERSEHESNILELQTLVKRGNDVVYVRRLCDQGRILLAQIHSYNSHRHPNVAKYYAAIERKETLRRKVDTLRHLLSNESLQLFPDFLQRKAVLRKLGYIAENETVCVKGRVACEVNTCEELIATEMVFEGLLNELDPSEIAAVLSALVFQEKNKDEGLDTELPYKLINCCQNMKIIATNLGQLQKEQGLEIDPGEYCDRSLKFGLVHVVYEWALGVPFKNICDLTDVQEGSIVRCITRLDELCREVRNCARVVGNPTLYRKLEAASVAIKRDIVFASSLYVS